MDIFEAKCLDDTEHEYEVISVMADVYSGKKTTSWCRRCGTIQKIEPKQTTVIPPIALYTVRFHGGHGNECCKG